VGVPKHISIYLHFLQYVFLQVVGRKCKNTRDCIIMSNRRKIYWSEDHQRVYWLLTCNINECVVRKCVSTQVTYVVKRLGTCIIIHVTTTTTTTTQQFILKIKILFVTMFFCETKTIQKKMQKKEVCNKKSK